MRAGDITVGRKRREGKKGKDRGDNLFLNFTQNLMSSGVYSKSHNNHSIKLTVIIVTTPFLVNAVSNKI